MGVDAGSGAGPGSVACQLTLAAAAARPGETVTALLQVSCSLPEAVELQEVEVEFTGIERIDTSWVQPAYRQSTPPINNDKRKVQRHVVQSRLQAATQGTFSDLSLRRFVVRFTLPAWLPPTFRGTAVRYLYYLQAVVRYRPALPQHSDGSSSEAGGAAANGAALAASSSAVVTRTLLQVWPLRADGGAERGSRALGGSSPLPPALQLEDVPIKCWEIGPGTAVQDAVAHIVRLASQAPQLARPHSPGGSLRPGGALPGGGSSACGDDSRSEISHEQQEGEGEAQVSPGSGGALPPLHTPAKHPAPAAAQDVQQNGGAAPPPTPASSTASTPRRGLPARLASLSRPSLEAAPRSPAHAVADSGSLLRSYALRIGDQPLVRVSLHPPLEGCLQPGSTLAGTLDFAQLAAAGGPPPGGEAAAAAAQAAASGAGPRCMQVLVLLETEEVVDASWRRPVQGGGGAVRRVYDEHLEVTADTACTHFLFTIPPDAAASFQTPLVSLRWLLRFQFTASLPHAGLAQREEWSPLQGRLEQLTWALPVTVLPPPM